MNNDELECAKMHGMTLEEYKKYCSNTTIPNDILMLIGKDYFDSICNDNSPLEEKIIKLNITLELFIEYKNNKEIIPNDVLIKFGKFCIKEKHKEKINDELEYAKMLGMTLEEYKDYCKK